eukprot:s836_g1.t1
MTCGCKALAVLLACGIGSLVPVQCGCAVDFVAAQATFNKDVFQLKCAPRFRVLSLMKSLSKNCGNSAFVGSNLSVAAHRLKMKASTVALMEDKDRSQLEKKDKKQSMTTDKIVKRNWQKVADSRVKIYNFLVRHGFDPENVNLRKTTRRGFLFDSYTFPLHVAAKQQLGRPLDPVLTEGHLNPVVKFGNLQGVCQKSDQRSNPSNEGGAIQMADRLEGQQISAKYQSRDETKANVAF